MKICEKLVTRGEDWRCTLYGHSVRSVLERFFFFFVVEKSLGTTFFGLEKGLGTTFFGLAGLARAFFFVHA